jgi:CubicO group peptidase (beta-lactamase class C family)
MFLAHAGPQAQTQGPGWGFGYGGALLVDPRPTGTPQSAGTLQWGGVYGHTWFLDRASGLSLVLLTNTAYEGMSGDLPGVICNAVYRLMA